ncbi:MAG TPA: hypothetical protein VEI07_09065 [Planctomycetaceae bacterium]|nr:hypothetical protein [Planctomycetaceae bacterium]
MELDDEAEQVTWYRQLIDTSALDVHALDHGATRTTAPRFDVLSLLPNLKERTKTAIRLHPRRLALDESLPRDVSKIGGDFLWPANEPWPTCEKHEIPWVGVLQLFQSDFPEFPFKPGTDLCQVLWCPTLEHGFGGAPEAVVRWRDSASIGPVLERTPRPRFQTHDEAATQHAMHLYLQARQMSEYRPPLFPAEPYAAPPRPKDPGPPKYAETSCVPLACRVFPERIVEYPRDVLAGELLEEERTILESMSIPADAPPSEWPHDSPFDYYYSEASVAPGTKLLGYPAWVQAPEYPKCARAHRMEHIISFDSKEETAGCWQAVEDRELAPRFYENRKDEPSRRAWYALREPTHLSFGDAGRNYVFLCRECPDWPTVTFLQCS